jgi:hypothetical protein
MTTFDSTKRLLPDILKDIVAGKMTMSITSKLLGYSFTIGWLRLRRLTREAYTEKAFLRHPLRGDVRTGVSINHFHAISLKLL